MSIFEFDEEREIKLIREDEYQYGVEDGIEQGTLKTLFELYRDNLISLHEAARRASLTEQNFLDATKIFIH